MIKQLKMSLTALIALVSSAQGDTSSRSQKTSENLEIFGFTPLPAPLLLAVIGLTTLYTIATEITKKSVYAKITNACA